MTVIQSLLPSLIGVYVCAHFISVLPPSLIGVYVCVLILCMSCRVTYRNGTHVPFYWWQIFKYSKQYKFYKHFFVHERVYSYTFHLYYVTAFVLLHNDISILLLLPIHVFICWSGLLGVFHCLLTFPYYCCCISISILLLLHIHVSICWS